MCPVVFYDATSQLQRATGAYGQLRYQYDAIGNMVNKQHDTLGGVASKHHLTQMFYGQSQQGGAGRFDRTRKGAYAGPHAMTQTASGLSVGYNALGQRINDSLGNQFSWDALGRLQQVERQSGHQQYKETYRYDFAGRRLQKQVIVKNIGITGTTMTKKVVHYVDKSYEIRDKDTQKHLFLGNLRVARLETPIAKALAKIQQYSLNPGWNALYFPDRPQGAGLQQQLQGLPIPLSVADLAVFNPSQQQWVANLHGHVQQRIQALDADQVVWLNVRGGKLADYPVTWQVPMQADNTQPVVRKLAQGWNQTRLPVASSTTIAQFVHGSPIERIFYYQASEDRWYRWYKGLEDEPGLNTLKTIEPERVYWVLSGREALLSQASGVTSERFFLHNNHLGSVSFTTDVDGGVVAETLYQPYGGQFGAGAVDGEKVPYSFTGKELDGSGFYYFEARFYDPLTTRFVSPDPLFASELEKCVGSVVECNLYQYTGNNPVGFVDLDGRLTTALSFDFTVIIGDQAAISSEFGIFSTDGGKNAATLGTGELTLENSLVVVGSIMETIVDGLLSKNQENVAGGTFETQPMMSDQGKTSNGGLDVDASFLVSFYKGGEEIFGGVTDTVGIDVGPLSVDFHFSPDSGEPTGISFGIGAGPPAASIQQTNTEVDYYD